MQTSMPHAVLLASPGMGHLTPILELGKRLATHHGLAATVFVVTTDSSISQSPLFMPPLTPNPLNIVLLPLVNVSTHVDQSAHIATQLFMIMRAALPSLREAIAALKIPPTALIVDLFGTEAMAIAKEFDLLTYVFITSTAWFLAATVHYTSLGKKERYDHAVLHKPLMIPGCEPVQFIDTLDGFLEHVDIELYREFSKVGSEITKAHGILVNTWQDLEPTTLRTLKDEKRLEQITNIPIYPIGPLVRSIEPNPNYEITNWLDMQPSKSAIYVSFGSGGTLSAEQMIELAWGIELSGKKFLWVVRPPVEDNACAAFFDSSKGKDGTPSYLPNGFFSRTSSMGLVVPMWAPQTHILAHKAIGGFLSHCGWNSTLESIVNGVPIVAWPLYAEQNMNATMLTESVKMALRPTTRPSMSGVIRREEIGKVIRELMEESGDGLRSRARELQFSAKEVMKKGGSSYNSLGCVAKECEMKLRRLNAKALGA